MSRGKKYKIETQNQKRRRLLAQHAALDQVDGLGSDKELGPFLVGEAATMIDLLDPAAGGDGFSWFERARDEEDFAQLVSYDVLRRMEATLRTLMRHAVYLACLAAPIAHAISARDSWVAAGIRWSDWSGGEHHAHCVFCDDNLVTLGDRRKRKERKFPPSLLRKLDQHVLPCAMRFLLTTHAAAVRSEAPPASPDRDAAEVST